MQEDNWMVRELHERWAREEEEEQRLRALYLKQEERDAWWFRFWGIAMNVALGMVIAASTAFMVVAANYYFF